jgi:hypothetical protein
MQRDGDEDAAGETPAAAIGTIAVPKARRRGGDAA